MDYVSARYAPPPAIDGDPQMIIATDEDGAEWWVTEDSQVGDWLRFVEAGGQIEDADDPANH